MKETGNKEVESILALLKSEQIDPCDYDACLISLSETCLPTKLTEIYKNVIYPAAKDSKSLGADTSRMAKWRAASYNKAP